MSRCINLQDNPHSICQNTGLLLSLNICIPHIHNFHGLWFNEKVIMKSISSQFRRWRDLTRAEFVDVFTIRSYASFSWCSTFTSSVTLDHQKQARLVKNSNLNFINFGYLEHPILNCMNTFHKHILHGLVLNRVSHQNGHKRSCRTRNNHHVQPKKSFEHVSNKN